MRQLGTLPDAQSARRLCDYLQSLAIETRLEPAAEGSVVWVLDEDKLPRAREELQGFLSNPSDPRYDKAAEDLAKASRKEEAREPVPRRRHYARSTLKPQPPQMTILFLVLSVGVTLLYWFPPTKPAVARLAFIEKLEVKEDGLYRRVNNRLDEVRINREVWRLVTPIFIHLHIVHLLFNMSCLWILGRALEQHMGSTRFLLFVLGVGILSNLAQYSWSEVRIVDWGLVTEINPAFGGISGVGYGLFGYLWMRVVYDPGCGLLLTREMVFVSMAWFFLCMTGALGPVANMAHTVGLALGMIVAYVSAWWHNFGQGDTNS